MRTGVHTTTSSTPEKRCTSMPLTSSDWLIKTSFWLWGLCWFLRGAEKKKVETLECGTKWLIKLLITSFRWIRFQHFIQVIREVRVWHSGAALRLRLVRGGGEQVVTKMAQVAEIHNVLMHEDDGVIINAKNIRAFFLLPFRTFLRLLPLVYFQSHTEHIQIPSPLPCQLVLIRLGSVYKTFICELMWEEKSIIFNKARAKVSSLLSCIKMDLISNSKKNKNKY